MSEDSTMISMVAFCSVALVALGIVYSILWYRAKNKQETFGTTPQPPVAAGPPVPKEAKFTDKRPVNNVTTKTWEPRQREPGEPVYDKLLVGGTVSLGVLTWIGATIVLIMSLVDQSNFKDANLGDFVSLGPDACLIENSTSYTYFDKRLDALNRLCVEEWEYQVRVSSSFLEVEEEEAIFVSSPISLETCRAKCELQYCSTRLFGPDWYAGVDPTKRGTNIDNKTRVECWAPTVPVEELSTFYPCGDQKENNGTCFLLQDTTVLLEERMNSSQIGLISAYACYGGGVFLLLVAAWFKLRNQQVLEEDREKLEALALEKEPMEGEEIKDVLSTTNLEEGGVVTATAEEDQLFKAEDGKEGSTPEGN